jgi:hypothetical protein
MKLKKYPLLNPLLIFNCPTPTMKMMLYVVRFFPFLFKGRHPNSDELGIGCSSENSIFGPINGPFYLALSKPTNW